MKSKKLSGKQPPTPNGYGAPKENRKTEYRLGKRSGLPHLAEEIEFPVPVLITALAPAPKAGSHAHTKLLLRNAKAENIALCQFRDEAYRLRIKTNEQVLAILDLQRQLAELPERIMGEILDLLEQTPIAKWNRGFSKRPRRRRK